MDYQKSIQSLLKEAKAGLSYKQLAKPYRIFLIIALFPLILAEYALIISYYVQLFFYNALMSPVTYLESWKDKNKEGIQHATQAVLYFVSTPFIFFLRVVLSLMSFNFFFLWFFLMCFTYLVTLGGIKWQPCINVVPEREGGETRLKAAAGERFATVAFVFFVLTVILAPFVGSANDAFMTMMGAYSFVIVVVNAIVSATARVPAQTEDGEAAPVQQNKPGMFSNFAFASFMVSIVAIFMFILALSYNGIDLFISSAGSYATPNGLPAVSVILLTICSGMALAALIHSTSMKAKMPMKSGAKTVFAFILAIICAVSALFGTVQYARYLIEEAGYNTESSDVTKTEIITIAKESYSVKSAIRGKWDLGTSYMPTYTGSSATQASDGTWTVTLSGTIYGYDSWNDYVGGAFIAYVTVSEYGMVMSTTVSKL